MKLELRRQNIINILTESEKPVSAGYLSEKFGVSRQIIVKDISALRNSGYEISSHSRGYVLENKCICRRVFKTIHSDEDVEKELNLIVDYGGRVEDVFVYHKFYNKVSAKMDIKTRVDVSDFLKNITSGKSSLLKNITSGYHYHTVSAENCETLKLIESKLREHGFLAPLQKYEPAEIEKLNDVEKH